MMISSRHSPTVFKLNVGRVAAREIGAGLTLLDRRSAPLALPGYSTSSGANDKIQSGIGGGE